MSFPLPTSLSPSKVSAFKDCALAFRFSAIDKLPQPPTVATSRGTLVHRALERLFWFHDPGDRGLEVGLTELDAAWEEFQHHPDLTGLELDPAGADTMLSDAEGLVRNYFTLEDPNRVHAIGTELLMEAQLPGGPMLRGIIDRLDLDDDGQLVVTDYKTGSPPGDRYEQKRLAGVHFYAFLCEQLLGRRPVRVQLLYLRDPVAIATAPSEQSIRAMSTQTRAIWQAVETACQREDFRAKPGPLCQYCAYTHYCPAQGGDLSLAALASVTALATGLTIDTGPRPAPAIASPALA